MHDDEYEGTVVMLSDDAMRNPIDAFYESFRGSDLIHLHRSYFHNAHSMQCSICRNLAIALRQQASPLCMTFNSMLDCSTVSQRVCQCFHSLSHIIVMGTGAVVWLEKRAKDRYGIMYFEYTSLCTDIKRMNNVVHMLTDGCTDLPGVRRGRRCEEGCETSLKRAWTDLAALRDQLVKVHDTVHP